MLNISYVLQQNWEFIPLKFLCMQSSKWWVHLLRYSLDVSCYHSLCFGNRALEWSSTVAKVCSVSWGLKPLKGGSPKQELLSASSYSCQWATGRDVVLPFLLLALVWELFSHLFWVGLQQGTPTLLFFFCLSHHSNILWYCAKIVMQDTIKIF